MSARLLYQTMMLTQPRQGPVGFKSVASSLTHPGAGHVEHGNRVAVRQRGHDFLGRDVAGQQIRSDGATVDQARVRRRQQRTGLDRPAVHEQAGHADY